MRFVTFAALAGLVVACTPKDNSMAGSMAGGAMSLDTAAVMAGVDSLRTSYSRLQVAGDMTGLAQLYTENATVDAYGMPRTKGRAAIEASLKADPRKFSASDIMPLATFPTTSAMASQIGTYHDLYDLNGTMTHEWGRYVVGADKGADGKWRLNYVMVFPDSTKAGK